MRQDVFPATVVITAQDFPVAIAEMRSSPPTKDAASIQIARVIIDDTYITIARDDVNGPLVVFREAVNSDTHFKSQKPLSEDSYITTVSGKKIAFRKDSGCGCGSRLKSWNPNKGRVSSMNDPQS